MAHQEGPQRERDAGPEDRGVDRLAARVGDGEMQCVLDREQRDQSEVEVDPVGEGRHGFYCKAISEAVGRVRRLGLRGGAMLKSGEAVGPRRWSFFVADAAASSPKIAQDIAVSKMEQLALVDEFDHFEE